MSLHFGAPEQEGGQGSLPLLRSVAWIAHALAFSSNLPNLVLTKERPGSACEGVAMSPRAGVHSMLAVSGTGPPP